MCAHNEGANVGTVLEAITRARPDEVLTVADACTDDTATVAADYGRVIEITAADKGTAMAAGLAGIATDRVLFMDADLRGLLPGHVAARLAAPPADGMVVGLRDGTRPFRAPPRAALPLRFPVAPAALLPGLPVPCAALVFRSGLRAPLSQKTMVGAEGLEPTTSASPSIFGKVMPVAGLARPKTSEHEGWPGIGSGAPSKSENTVLSAGNQACLG